MGRHRRLCGREKDVCGEDPVVEETQKEDGVTNTIQRNHQGGEGSRDEYNLQDPEPF